MFRTQWNRVWLVTVSALAVALLSGVPGIRAEEKVPVKEHPAAKQDKEKAHKRAARRGQGRLPAFYGQVVTGDQRIKIYAIQAKYRQRIEALMAELKQLRTERQQAVEAVLTPDQKDKLAKLRSEAKESRRKKAAERKKQTTTQ